MFLKVAMTLVLGLLSVTLILSVIAVTNAPVPLLGILLAWSVGILAALGVVRGFLFVWKEEIDEAKNWFN